MTIDSTLTFQGPASEISEMLHRLVGPNISAATVLVGTTDIETEISGDAFAWSPDAQVDGADVKESVKSFEQPTPLTETHAAKITYEMDETYFADDGFVNFHKLRDFASCPYEFRYFPKQIARSPLTDIGSMIHKYVLEGVEAFHDTYQLWTPPINPKTNKEYGKDTQAYQKAWQDMGLPETAKLYTNDDMFVVDEIVASIRRHPLVSQYFSEQTQKLTEFTVRIDDPDFLKIKSKIDMYHECFGLVDFKTTDSLDQFRWKSRDYGYVEQLSFYHWLLTDFLGAAYCPAWLIVAEYSAPYRVGLFKVNAIQLQWGRDTVQKWLREYQTCLESDVWPTRYEDEKELR